jgi:hypothetical protein
VHDVAHIVVDVTHNVTTHDLSLGKTSGNSCTVISSTMYVLAKETQNQKSRAEEHHSINGVPKL